MTRKKKTAKDYANKEMISKYSVKTKSSKGRTISPYDRLKRRIIREFPKKKLIGDIVINDEEFRILIEYMQLFYKYMRILDWEICSDQLVCVSMVQIGIRYYDGGYWPHFAHLLNNSSWTVSRQAVMGKVCILTLKSCNKYILDESDRINTILMHGFVANKYAPKLMDFLYAYYRIDLERDLSRNDREMMHELIRSIQNKDNTNRTYKLVQQTSDAVTCNPRGCNIRLRWLLKLIDASFWDEEVRINPENRLAVLFSTWAEQSYSLQKNRGTRGSRHKVFSSPHISFDPANGLFSIQLPSQIVRSDDDIVWCCNIENQEQIIATEAYESVLAFKTEPIWFTLTAKAIFNKMSFQLKSGDYIKRFSIPKENVRFFNKEGVSVSIASLKTGEYYAFSCYDKAVFSTSLVEKRKHYDLWFYYLVLEDGDIVKTFEGKAVSIGKKIEEGILLKGIVSGATAEEDKLPIFNRVPSILIKIPESKLPGTAIQINNKKYRFQESCEITEIQLGDGSDNKGYWFSLEDFGCNHDGLYSVSVDVPNDKSVRLWKYILLKDFNYSFDSGAPYIFTARGTIKLSTKNHDTVDVLDGEIEPDVESGYYNFTISHFHRQLVFSINNIKVDISVPQLEYSFDNEKWFTQRQFEIWYSDLPRKIWVYFPTNRIAFEMENGEISDQDYKVTFEKRTYENIFECDLTRFRSWINHERVRNSILFNVFGKSIPFLDVITKSYVISAIPEADFENRRIIIKFDIFGKCDYYVDLWYEKLMIAEKIPLIEQMAIIDSPIHSGKYEIELFESDSMDDFGFDDLCYTSIFKQRTNIINPRDLTGKSVEILSIMKDENDLFKMRLSHKYIVRGLKSIDDEGYRYEGQLVDYNGSTKPIDVILELLELEKLRFSFINWIDHDYNDEVEFLYDSYDKILLCEEDTRIRSAERYRRYDCIFSEDFLYEIRII